MTYAQAGFLAFMWFGIYTESLMFFGLALGFVLVQLLDMWAIQRKERIMFEMMDKIHDVCNSKDESKKESSPSTTQSD